MVLRHLPEFAVDRAHVDWAELSALVHAERFARDQGDWDTLERAYAPWAHIHTTWFEGTPAEFAEASRRLAEQGRHAKHVIWPLHGVSSRGAEMPR